jgi:uncharacterized protein (TIGR00661 family)
MNSISESKTILVAPLNWGLGHATRCIPIIKALQEHNYIPIIASDGIALELLKKEFPYVQTLKLPSYQIAYTKDGKNLKWKLVKNLPKLLKAIWKEEKKIRKWVKKYEIDGIISDNRLGVFSKKIPSVYLTHQLNVLSGNTTWLSTALHHNIIKKHQECWVPDWNQESNLTGKLGRLKYPKFHLKYIGPLSRMQKKEAPILFDLMIILSGPEPQRGLLEIKLIQEIQNYQGSIVFIKGIIEKEQKKEQIENVIYYNFMNSSQLERTFNESKWVLCRSGYSTIMDLVQLGKKAFFIPTPGQYEQEYLAKKLKEENLVPFTKQENFQMENLNEIENYKGLPLQQSLINWKELFEVFEK